MIYKSALQVMDIFAEKQRLEHVNWLKNGLVAGLKEGEYHAISIGDGSYRLAPYPESNSLLFRGQNRDYANCLPTLYRDSESLCKRIFELSKVHELKLSLENIGGYKQYMPILGQKFSVDYEALAQHYGLKSRYIDFTTNPIIAAFFACTRYDAENEQYEVIDKPGIGVFYEVNSAVELSKGNDVEIIGLQPFHRPAQQYAFGLKCNKRGLFEKYSITKYKFIHSTFSHQLFEYLKGGEFLFKNDPVSSVVQKIAKSNIVSRESIEWAMDSLKVRCVAKQIQSLEAMGIVITTISPDYISSDERLELELAWKEQQSIFLTKVKYRRIADHLVLS